MNDALRERFIQLISARTGLLVRERDREALDKKIWMRIKALKLSLPEDYFKLLETHSESSRCEWKALILLLTTGETYFFRDRGQFALLQKQILPQLIEVKRKEAFVNGLQKPTLRIWSAGCSTGEEPYSLAIVLNQLLFDKDRWNILIIGTDLNQEAIEKAKQGIYNSWSFRLVEPHLMQYFHQRKDRWELNEKIRGMVTFRDGNLIQDNFPSHYCDIHRMDLIVCRNVFVYFDFKAISAVVEKFYHTLNSGGYLLTGHTELYGQDLGKFHLQALSESVIYQRREEWQVDMISGVRSLPTTPLIPTLAKAETVAIEPANSLLPSPRPTKDNFTEIGVDAILKQVELLFKYKAYDRAIQKAEQLIQLGYCHFKIYYTLARSHANLGEHERAIYYCQMAIDLDSLSVLPYYLLAHIAEEKGEMDKAKSWFKRIIYLAPMSISAYLELGSLYRKEGDETRARKMFSTAFELLKQLPSSATVETQGELSVNELLAYVEKMLTVR